MFDCHKVKDQPRENLFHLCARYNFIRFSKTLFRLPGAFEALKNKNRKQELPVYVAMKNQFTQIADLM
jgi:hypothetical protein